MKTQEEVLKIWIFQSICLKWHAAEKLKQPQSNMSYTYLSLIPLRMTPWKKYPPSWRQVTTLSYTIYVYLVPTYPILHWRLANSHLKRNRIGLESDVIWWSHPKSLNISPVASYFYWCTGETVVTAVTTKFLYASTLHWATTQTALDPVGLILLHKTMGSFELYSNPGSNTELTVLLSVNSQYAHLGPHIVII